MTLVELVEKLKKRDGRSIKSLKPNPKSRYKDGYFPKDKCTKYIGSQNEPCIYRSSLEFRTFMWAENHPSVKHWVSEPFSIPYYTEELGKRKRRNYNIDLVLERTDGEIWFIEIKPYAFTRVGSLDFEKNKAKWNAAIRWCKEQPFNINFKIITEKFNFYT